MMMKVNKIKLYSCVGMLTLSCVLLGCSSNQEVTSKEEVVEEPKEETTEQTPEEEKTLVDQYMDLPIYTDQDRAAFEDIKDSFTGAFDTSSLEDMKEKWVQKIDYFKRFLQNDPTATYGGYTFSELSDTAQEKAKELYHKIDQFFSEHISFYDEAKENIKNGTQKVIERAKNGWNRFKDNEGKEIKEKTSEWFDKYFPEEY